MMNRNKCISILVMIMFAMMITSIYSEEDERIKLAQTGFQFLSVGQSARASALGEAFTTMEGTASSLFYNPAGIARLPSFIDIVVNQNSWIADIRHNSFGIALSPKDGNYGVIGISAMWVDYGDFQGTMIWENNQGYIDTEIFSPEALAIGITYAKYITDRFSVGGQIKNVAQSLGRNVIPEEGLKKNIASTWAIDFGTIFNTGYKSLSFGMSVRNFSREIEFEQEEFELPLTFKIGISMNVLDFIESMPDNHSLMVLIDAVHPRSYPEYINLGCEYNFMNILALRTGYISNQNEYNLTYGFGLQKFGLAFDFAYTPFSVFENVKRITVRFSM